jgi:cholesterol transport system auxiliary component
VRVRSGRASGLLLGVVLGLSVAGCALVPPPGAEATRAVLNKIPSEVPQRASRSAVMLVLPPQARPIYDTTQMAYSVQPYEVAYFSQHEWGETPSRMLQPLLVTTLQNTGYFAAVITPAYGGRYSYALRTEIRELIADFTSEPPLLRLSLRCVLQEGAAGQVIAVKEISIREPMQQKTPRAAVVAANEATAKALQELARFVLDKAD